MNKFGFGGRGSGRVLAELTLDEESFRDITGVAVGDVRLFQTSPPA